MYVGLMGNLPLGSQNLNLMPPATDLYVGIFRMCVFRDTREIGWLPPDAVRVRQDQGNVSHGNNLRANT